MNVGDNNYRLERIERLLAELEYETRRGMMEGELEEEMFFQYVVPISKNLPQGLVLCQFRTRPIPAEALPTFVIEKPGLKVIKGGKEKQQ